MTKLAICTAAILLGLPLLVAQDLPLPPPAKDKELEQRNQQLQVLQFRSRAQADYLLGVGDLLKIEVVEMPEINKEVQIAQDGQIYLAYLSAVKVAGLTVYELQQKLESLLAQSLLNDPHVSVTVKEYRSQPVYLLGEVTKPGTYQMTRAMFLVDLLTLGGGFTGTAGETCTISRTDAQGRTERREIDLKQLLEAGDLSLNVPILAGDIIHVNKKVERYYYVLGEVGRPGAYPISPEKDTCLTEALTTAGGYSKTAKVSDAKLVRTRPDGTREIIAMDLGKVLEGKTADRVILENDLIFVPNSRTKSIGQSIVNGSAGILTSMLFFLK